MVPVPNDLFSWNNKAMSTMLLRVFTRFLLVGYARQLTLCMIAFWSHEGVVFFPPSHLITSFHITCLGSTDAHWPHLGAPDPSPPNGGPSDRVRAHSLTRVQNSSAFEIVLWLTVLFYWKWESTKNSPLKSGADLKLAEVWMTTFSLVSLRNVITLWFFSSTSL